MDAGINSADRDMVMTLAFGSAADEAGFDIGGSVGFTMMTIKVSYTNNSFNEKCVQLLCHHTIIGKGGGKCVANLIHRLPKR